MTEGAAGPTSPATAPGRGRVSWGRRVGWLVLIWAASVAALGLVALGIRLMMNAAGLTA